MTIEQRLRTKFIEIIDIARLAPSVHNSQPWIVKTNGSKIEIEIDPAHVLTDGDPTGRETIISLGIFTEAVVLAAKSLGLRSVRTIYDDRKAAIAFAPDRIKRQDTHAIKLLNLRCTDRSIYKPASITPKITRSFTGARKQPGVSIKVVMNQSQIETIAELTSKGIRMALSSLNFRKELSEYLVVPGSQKKRGISTRSLYLNWLVEMIEPWLMRAGFGQDTEARLEKRRWLSSSAVIIITTSGDMPMNWFEAGRSYLRVSLEAEEAGLSQATSAAIVEASDFHEDIEALLHTKQRIQCLIRVGKGKRQRHHSPRVNAEELIAT